MYLFSNSRRILLAGGMMKFPKIKDIIPNIVAEIKKGRSNLLKLTPLFSMGIISVLLAILEVKKTTAMKVNKGLNKFPKYGAKLT